MKEVEKKILELISYNYKVSDILSILNISKEEFALNLKTLQAKGYAYQKLVDEVGSTYFIPLINNNFKLAINESKLNILVISDLHLGRKKDNLDIIRQVYNFAKKESIGVVLNLGDFLENVYHLPSKDLKYCFLKDQIDYVIKQFPYDDNIVTINLYGNHDFRGLIDEDIDVGKIIEEGRVDLINLGYHKAILDMQNDHIFLGHNQNGDAIKIYSSCSLFLNGHSHRMRIKYGEKPFIYVPTLSNLIPDSYKVKPIPGFLEMDFVFYNNGMIKSLFIKNYIIVNSSIRLSSEENMQLVRKGKQSGNNN